MITAITDTFSLRMRIQIALEPHSKKEKPYKRQAEFPFIPQTKNFFFLEI